MTEAQDMTDATQSSSSAVRRGSRRARAGLTVVLSLLGVFALGFVLDYVSASPDICVACHEMELRVHGWERSAHNTVACVECHTTPRPWYAVPLRIGDRAALLARDMVSHVAGGFSGPIDEPSAGSEAIEDDVCLQCHDANRKATSGYRILIDHVEHAARNGSCVSCHVRTAHPIESRGRALTLMAQCYTCHGTPEMPEASAECGVCHPADYELIPATHIAQTWPREHGETALSDTGLCGMCHERQECTDCHGVEMPHPDGWERGATGHAVVAATDRAVCAPCHGETLDMCTMCHHTGYDPSRGTWVKQHFSEVEKRGAAYCMDECHAPVYCIRCHAGSVPVPGDE